MAKEDDVYLFWSHHGGPEIVGARFLENQFAGLGRSGAPAGEFHTAFKKFQRKAQVGDALMINPEDDPDSELVYRIVKLGRFTHFPPVE